MGCHSLFPGIFQFRDQTRVSCIASEFSNFKNEGNSDMCYTWIKLEDVMPSEISQLQKEKSCTIPHTWSTQSPVQSLSHVRLFVTPWTTARQASQSFTNSQSLLKLMFIELGMPSKHLTLCCPLLLPPSIFPSIRVFSSESVLHIKWPTSWSFSFSISPSNKYSGLISFRMD